MGRVWTLICGLVVALGIGLLTIDANAQGQKGQTGQQAAQAQAPTPASEGQGADDLNKECRPGEDNRKSDLCAQWKAADAAADSAEYSLHGLFVGAITMVAAIAAAVFAKLASDHTRTGSVANVAANNLAARQYKDGFKPWLSVSISGDYVRDHRSTGLVVGGNPVTIEIHATISITNLTDMPATIVAEEIEILGGKARSKNHGSDVFQVLGKGDSYVIESGVDVIPIGYFVATIRNDHIMNPAPIIGSVTYTDPLNVRRKLAFAFRPSVWHTNDFERWGGPEYNYDREIEPS